MNTTAAVFVFLFLVFVENTLSQKNITDAELATLTEELLKLDVENNATALITINLQANRSNQEHLQSFLNVSPSAYNRPTIKGLLRLLDNYHASTNVTEEFTEQQETEIESFVDLLFKTKIISRADAFLKEKEFPNGKENFKRIWFQLYQRSWRHVKNSSSGFEHVFVGEITPGVGGLHNWVQFSMEELTNRLVYLGYSNAFNIGPHGSVIELGFEWNDVKKSRSTMFVGTSPEFEMAVYTVCFYAREDSKCRISLGGGKLEIQTYVQFPNKERLIATSYPDIYWKTDPTTEEWKETTSLGTTDDDATVTTEFSKGGASTIIFNSVYIILIGFSLIFKIKEII